VGDEGEVVLQDGAAVKIGIVTQWYAPEPGGAAASSVAALALKERGHDVRVVTGFPSYPIGEIYDGYSLRPHAREFVEGIDVHRVAMYPSHSTRMIPRLATYASFAAAATAASVSRCLREVDVVLVHSTPATVALPAMGVRAVHGTPYALWIQDLWPQTVTSSGFLDAPANARAERILHRFCDLTYRGASRIAVSSPGMASLIESRGVPAEKITFIPNWPDERAFHPAEPTEWARSVIGASRPITIMYAGNLGEMQSLDTVLDAAALLRDRPEVGIVLMGGGVAEEHLRTRVRQEGLDNVQFVAPQGPSRIAELLAVSDAQLVTLKDVPLMRTTLPSKLQANLAIGKPMVVSAAGDVAAVVRDAGAGFISPPGDGAALAGSIRDLAALSISERAIMGQSARKTYLTKFGEAVSVDALESLLVATASEHRRPLSFATRK